MNFVGPEVLFIRLTGEIVKGNFVKLHMRGSSLVVYCFFVFFVFFITYYETIVKLYPVKAVQ